VHQFFALPNRSGLPDVLTDELLHDGKVPASAMQDRIACELWSVARYLWVIVSRPAPPKVAAQLGSDAMRRLLEAQRGSFDYIILDCPPALAAATVADQVELASRLATIDWICAHVVPPRLARTLMVSTLARFQSSRPCAPRRSKTTRCS
jgi:Mrp family chromosome partitioning ATPase